MTAVAELATTLDDCSTRLSNVASLLGEAIARAAAVPGARATVTPTLSQMATDLEDLRRLLVHGVGLARKAVDEYWGNDP